MNYLEVQRGYDALLKISNERFPRKMSAAIAKNLITFESELNFYDSQRHDIAARYAERDSKGVFVSENGNYVFSSEERKQMFLEEVNELNHMNITSAVVKFKASELEKCDTDDRYALLTPAQEVAISWMIDFEEENDNGKQSDK